MSSRADRILKFVKNYINIHGYAPTRREIGRKLHLSTSVVSYHLRALEDKGQLTVAKEIARGIVLTEQPAPDNAELRSSTFREFIKDVTGQTAPCPFCGNDDNEHRTLMTLRLATPIHYVKCESCAACGPISVQYPDAVSAIDSWNKQPAPDNAEWQMLNKAASR